MRFIQFALLAASILFSTLAFGATVNVNTASASELAAAAKGIGPTKAQAIVKYRKKHGDFTSVDELEKVKGIGPETVKDNRTVFSVADSDGSGESSSGE